MRTLAQVCSTHLAPARRLWALAIFGVACGGGESKPGGSAEEGGDAGTEGPVGNGDPSGNGSFASGDGGPDASRPPCTDAEIGGPGPDRHVYVDQATPPGGNGSIECPLQTLGEAFALGQPPEGETLTIHVAGDAATLYAESAPIQLLERMTLTSAWGSAPPDPTKVILSASGSCEDVACAVNVVGGTLEGVTVTVPSGAASTHGIRAAASPTLRDVSVTGATGSGVFVVAGNMRLGPGLHARTSGTSGITINGSASEADAPVVELAGGGRGNRFNQNSLHGIHMTGAFGILRAEHAEASSNQHTGLLVGPRATGSAHRLASVTASSNSVGGARVTHGPVEIEDGVFDDNGTHGVAVGNAVDYDATTTIKNTRANDNGGDGVRIDTFHTLEAEGLTARGNGKNPGVLAGGAGLFVTTGTTVKLRGSKFLGNTVGVVFNQRRNEIGVPLSFLDIGPSAGDLGGNVFGASPATSNNVRSGLCLWRSGDASTQPAVGNGWSSCAPAQVVVATCYDVPAGGYADVVYVPFDAGANPLDAGGTTAPACSVGTP